MIEPTAVRHMIRGLAGNTSMLTLDATATAAEKHKRGNNCVAHFREILRAVRAATLEFRGVAPTQADIWDLATVGLRSRTRTGRREQSATVDLTAIRQTWLRELLKRWVEVMTPENSDFVRMLRACLIASDALHARPGGGQTLADLRYVDMQAVFTAMCNLRRADGELLNRHGRSTFFSIFNSILDFGRTADLLPELPASFMRHPSMTVPPDETTEDAAGQAIPEPVIAQLDANLADIGAGVTYGDLAAEDIHLMLTTAYTVLRDTGRRPVEVTSLRRDCLEVTDDGDVLIWDNHKKRRYGRKLPVTGETAEAIRRWQARRDLIPVLATSKDYLFPAITHRSGVRHMEPGYLGTYLREWVKAIPELVSDQLNHSGNRLPFDRALIFPYAFRHSYAQRHANAGIPVDVLKELMDHRSIVTTMGYYDVSMKRKREAVQTMRLHAVDRAGRPAPFATDLAYEARSVAVPFGNCTEPSNIKAGGKSCPPAVPVRRLRFLPARPVLPARDRGTPQRAPRRSRDRRGHGHGRLRGPQPHRPDQRLHRNPGQHA
ncbi:site-specific integrase [Streptomyces sp. NBC_00353]|uniref:tyrosine-type recombinase/integrase n=1 Tax=Streptomyces sp. NBC_00353 TaxID=2975722 RepID=UPI002E27377E